MDEEIKPGRKDNPPKILPEEDTARLAEECLRNPKLRDQPFLQVVRDLRITAPKAVLVRLIRAAGLGRVWRMKKPKTNGFIRSKRLAFANQHKEKDINFWRYAISPVMPLFALGGHSTSRTVPGPMHSTPDALQSNISRLRVSARSVLMNTRSLVRSCTGTGKIGVTPTL